MGPKPALGCFWTEVTQRLSAQHGECTCPAMVTREADIPARFFGFVQDQASDLKSLSLGSSM